MWVGLLLCVTRSDSDHLVQSTMDDTCPEAGRFVQYEEARDRGILMFLDTYQDAVDFCRFNHVFFLSHQWLDATEPDPDNHHYEASVAAITDTMRRASRQNKPVDMKNTYIWVDYMSIPQKNMTLQSLAIDTIAVYAYLPEYFIIIAPCVQHTEGHWCSPSSYLDRGWCRLEQWARMSGNGTDNMYCYTKDTLFLWWSLFWFWCLFCCCCCVFSRVYWVFAVLFIFDFCVSVCLCPSLPPFLSSFLSFFLSLFISLFLSLLVLGCT